MIAIVDYGVNNLASVRNAFLAAGGDVSVTCDPAVIREASGVVLPGIGAASAGMKQLEDRGLVDPLRTYAASGRPFFGVCLGMQLLFERSEEGRGAECLGLLPGVVKQLSGVPKVPHIGWNQVEGSEGGGIWAGLPEEPYFYFVHSYVCEPADPKMVAGTTEYGKRFTSVVVHESVWGSQFHPERSGRLGLQLIRNFIARCGPV